MGFLSCRPHRSTVSSWNSTDEGFHQLVQSVFSGWPSATIHSNWSPALDIQEKEDHYEIKVDLPGVDKKDIEVNLEDDLLSVSGKRDVQTEKEKDGRSYRERFSGSFTRRVRLPEDVNPEKVKATYNNGVLHLALEKQEEARKRNVKVDVK